MDIKKLITEYTDWLKQEITTASFGEYVELTTPYLDRFNDYLQIYVRQNADGTITLSDDGYIIGNLISSGMNFKKSSSRHKMLERIARAYQVNIQGEEISTIARAGSFAKKKHMMVQAMIAVDDLYQVSTENVKSYFLEDLEHYFEANDIFYSKDFPLLGKTETLYHYDFHFQRTKKSPERFCKAFNKLNQSKRDLTLFNWIDTQEQRKDASELIVVFNDINSVSDDVLKGFENYKIITMPFSEREQKKNIELFSA